jgi:uncharacterized membrane protein YeiH
MDVLDAAGLALFSVTGASIALAYRLAPREIAEQEGASP